MNARTPRFDRSDSDLSKNGTYMSHLSENVLYRALYSICLSSARLSKDDNVPILLGPVVSRDRDRPVEENLRLSESGFYADVAYKLGESVKLFSACDLSALACVVRAASFLRGGLIQFSLEMLV